MFPKLQDLPYDANLPSVLKQDVGLIQNSQSFQSNLLLRGMAKSDLTYLAPHMHRHEFSKGDKVGEIDPRLPQIIFLSAGVATVTMEDRKRRFLIQMVGMEGMLGLEVILGAKESYFTARMDTNGSGWSVPTDVFMSRLEASPALHDHIFRYVRFSQIQGSHLASIGGWPMKHRIAAVLLMLSDRLRTLYFRVTHQELATRLNVQRPGATMAIHDLESLGLVRSTRGIITIVDRDRLIETSDGAYGQAEAAYRRLFGWPLTDRPSREP